MKNTITLVKKIFILILFICILSSCKTNQDQINIHNETILGLRLGVESEDFYKKVDSLQKEGKVKLNRFCNTYLPTNVNPNDYALTTSYILDGKNSVVGLILPYTYTGTSTIWRIDILFSNYFGCNGIEDNEDIHYSLRIKKEHNDYLLKLLRDKFGYEIDSAYTENYPDMYRYSKQYTDPYLTYKAHNWKNGHVEIDFLEGYVDSSVIFCNTGESNYSLDGKFKNINYNSTELKNANGCDFAIGLSFLTYRLDSISVAKIIKSNSKL